MFDLDSPDFFQNPYRVYAEMRKSSPVYAHRADKDAGPGPETVYSTGVSWYVTRYDDCRLVLKDFRRFVHDFRLALTDEELRRIPPTPPLMEALGANLTGVEPPAHTKLRGLVSQAFARSRVAEMKQLVESITEDLVDRVEDQGRMELMEDFAFPLPITIITGMLGLPVDDQALLREWTEVKPPRNEAEAVEVLASLQGAKEYVDAQLAARRKAPTDDLITALMKAEIEGEKLGEIELFSMIMMIIVAGFETTVNLIGNGMLALLDHPSEMEALRSDPTLGESAVEEMLRFDCPLEHSLTRWVAEDTELRGQKLSRGDRLVVVQAAANRDSDRFEDPDRFDIRRGDRQHLAFGHGIHYCLGAPLARLEAPIAFGALLARLPGLRLGMDRKKIRFRPNLPFRGLDSLPLEWDS